MDIALLTETVELKGMGDDLEFVPFENLPLVVFQMLSKDHILDGLALHADKVMVVPGTDLVMGGSAAEPHLTDHII